MAFFSDDFYCDKCERSFVSAQALWAHLTYSWCHHYCADCERDFANDNALRQHLASKRHQAPLIFCLLCQSGFVSASAFIKHFEKGGCFNLTNQEIVCYVREYEEMSGNPNIWTKPRTGWQDRESRNYTTEASYNGHCYVCPVCDRGFLRLLSLKAHLNSNVHEPLEFRCRECSKEFRELSAIVGHVESEACGAMSADEIRDIVRDFCIFLTNI